MAPIDIQEVSAWLEAFATCVRDRDQERGQSLFDPDAAGFGTVASRYDGLDDLVRGQWSQVWPRTAEFAFDGVDHRWLDGTQCVVAATWRSVGTDGEDRRIRTGRATLVLRRSGSALVAVHTHFSMTPGTTA